jgi:NADH dehydrogenase
MLDQRITVFGGSGFLGRHTVRALAKGGFGYRIRVGVRQPNLANFLLPMGHVGQIQLLRTNVRNEDDIAHAVANSDAVVNLVGILYQSGAQKFEALHAEAAGAMAKAAKAAGARAFVHISAIGADPESDSKYANTKAEGEARVREAFPEATILRPSVVFGPEDSFFNRFAWLARMSPVLPLIGGGHTKFQPVFVGDVAKAVAHCIENDNARGKTYELGGPASYSFKELMQLMLQVTERRRVLLPIPVPIAMMQGAILQLLPSPLLTMDQVRLLKNDNVVSPGALTLADLGIQPEPAEAVLPTYLWRFRRKGQFEESVQERVSGTPATR